MSTRQAREGMAAAEADRRREHIRQILDEAPPLTDEQAHRIVGILTVGSAA